MTSIEETGDTNYMNVISNRCLGALLLKRLGKPFVNPFIWSACSYDSIIYTMEHYDEIDWYNYEISKSTITKGTCVITVENQIELHYMHHIFDQYAKNPIIEKDDTWHGEVRYYKIWEIVNDNYLRRVERIRNAEDPVFLICDQTYPLKNKHNINDIAYNDSRFKRIILTIDKTISRNDNVCKTIYIDRLEDFNILLDKNMENIISFLF